MQLNPLDETSQSPLGPTSEALPALQSLPRPERLRPPRRVAFIINRLTYGGAEVQVVAVARELARRGWQVGIFTLRPPRAFVDELASDGILVKCRGLPLGRRAWWGAPWLIRELRAFAPDIVHSHMYRSNIFARAIRPLARPPVLICTAHNTIEGDGPAEHRGRTENLYRWTDRLCDLTTNVSDTATERYLRLGAVPSGRIRTVVNGIDTTRFRPDAEARARVRAELGLGDRPVVLAVGRFMPQKNYPLMIEAFAHVLRAHRSAVLLLVGAGERRGRVERAIAEHGVADAVRFLGLRSDVPDLMSAADLYIMSSDWEGLPIVLLEASASGLPAVVTDVGGNAEIVLDGVSGRVIPPGDADALGTAMTDILGMPPEQRAELGRAAREHVEQRYSLSAVVDEWERTYEALFARKAGRRVLEDRR